MLNNREIKSRSINSPRVGNWNCLYCGQIKSCHINSPHVEDWYSKFCVQYRNVNPSPRSKRDWSNSPFVTLATTRWKIQSLFLLSKGLGQCYNKNNISVPFTDTGPNKHLRWTSPSNEKYVFKVTPQCLGHLVLVQYLPTNFGTVSHTEVCLTFSRLSVKLCKKN